MKARTASLSWLRRLFSSKDAPALPAAVWELLQAAPVDVHKFAGQGRGLVARRDMEYGEVLFREQPFVGVPAASKRKQICYMCLRVLPGGPHAACGQPGAVFTREHAFCSQDCLQRAAASFYQLESSLDLRQLDRYCEQHNERFPLLAARLALMVAQHAMAPQADEQAAAGAAAAGSRFSAARALSSSSYLSTASNRSTSSSSTRQSGGIGRLSAASSTGAPLSALGGDPSGDLAFLCYANVPPPPPAPWQQAHKLLVTALQAGCSCREDPLEGEALAAAVEHLDINWYVAVLARLHLNVFKVQGVLPLDWGSGGHAAMAAMVGGDGATGSALYLLASLLNHSCEPNVNVNWPNNDGAAVFTAARRISAGEQLFISYTDTEQEVSIRQEYLAFAYGIRCACPRCEEELAEAARDAPPQL